MSAPRPWDLPPGLELDAAVGRALGLEPRVEWMLSRDGGESYAAVTGPDEVWRTKRDLEIWVERRRIEHQASFAGYEILPIDTWPWFSTNDGRAIWAVKRLVERGFAVSVFHDRRWACTIRLLGGEARVCEMCQADEDPDSPALAISRAIVAAARRWPDQVRGAPADG